METLIPTHKFSPAKTNLSDLMSKVVRSHQPQIIQRQSSGKEDMLLMDPSDMVRLLGSFRFDPRVTIASGEVTAALPKLGVLGFGSTTAEAIDDLVIELRRVVQRFFEKPAFYLETQRGDQLPWLLRFALTPDHKQCDLMYEEPPDA